jgi:glutaredoxin
VLLVPPAALAVLVAGQLLHVPPTFRAYEVGAGGPAVAPGAATAPREGAGDERERPGGERERFVDVHGGSLRLRLDEFPLLGSPDAPLVVVSLADYTCPHCRRLHGHLKQVLERFAGKLAILCLPIPMDGECNGIMEKTPPHSKDACKYTRIALAVWRARADAFPDIDDALFAPERPLAVEEARRLAEGLVGAEAFAKASEGPWFDAMVRRMGTLFRRNFRETGKPDLPQLILGSKVIVGGFRDADELSGLVEAALAVSLPAGRA